MKKTNISNYKKTLSKFTTGITIVCIKKNGVIIGKTINSFNSLSLNPPLILFSLGNYSSNFKSFFDTKYLSVNILSKNQREISNHFSKKNPIQNKVEYYDGKNKTVIIKDCIANLECRLLEKIKKGDHTIFICRVLNVVSNDKLKPLYYFNSRYY